MTTDQKHDGGLVSVKRVFHDPRDPDLILRNALAYEHDESLTFPEDGAHVKIDARMAATPDGWAPHVSVEFPQGGVELTAPELDDLIAALQEARAMSTAARGLRRMEEVAA